MAERFRPSQRLRQRREYVSVYERGQKAHGRLMTVFVLPRDGPSRLGIAATRKFGSAVERNRAKRLVREIFRRHPVGRGLDIVVIPRRALLTADFRSLEAEYVDTVARRLRRAR